MSWKRFVIPPYVVPALWILSVISTIVFFYLQQSISNLAIFYTLSLASAAAFLAAGVGMWTYSFINKRSQDREFNRDIEVRYFEEIYGPLYEEIWRVADELKAWGYPDLKEWPRVGKSRFEPVIDQRVKDRFFGLSQGLNDYVRWSQPCWDAAKACIQLAIGANLEFNALPAQTKADLVPLLHQDRFFLFDDTVENLNVDVINRIQEILAGTTPGSKGVDLIDFLRPLKPVLRANTIIAGRSKKREQLYQSVVDLGAIVLERMKPFHET